MGGQRDYITCEHEWLPHFNEVIDKTDVSMRVGVCIVCKRCGMFRTKVLELRYPKEIVNEAYE